MLWLRFEAATWVRITLPAVVFAALAALGAALVIRSGVVPLAVAVLFVVVGAVAGGLFGVLLGQRNESFAILEPLGSRRARAAAQRGVRRGPVPADPAIRQATVALARLQLSFQQDAQRRMIAVMIGGAVIFGFLALISHDWVDRVWTLGLALVYVWLAAKYPRDFRRLRDRLPLLVAAG